MCRTPIEVTKEFILGWQPRLFSTLSHSRLRLMFSEHFETETSMDKEGGRTTSLMYYVMKYRKTSTAVVVTYYLHSRASQSSKDECQRKTLKNILHCFLKPLGTCARGGISREYLKYVEQMLQTPKDKVEKYRIRKSTKSYAFGYLDTKILL